MIGREPKLDDLDQEIREHIEQETQDNIGRGMPPDEARFAALRKFGNIARVKERTRAVWLPDWVDAIRQDVRDGLRRLRRAPGFSLVVVLTLALGIGLSTVAYSVINAVLFRPLAYPDAERVVWLSTTDQAGQNEIMSSIEFAAWRDESTSFERLAAYFSSDATVATADESSRARIAWASDGFWEISGARPALGQLPASGDRRRLVLTHQYFTDQFRGDPGIIGRPVSVNGQQLTVAAVLPADFHPQLPATVWRPGITQLEVDAYRPLVVEPPPREWGPKVGVQVFLAIGKLKPGVSVDAAHAEIETIHVRTLQRMPGGPNAKSKARLTPLQDRLVDETRPALWVSLAAVLLVLLITCANVANLLLARASARQKEIALRMSVGGGPLRVLRQLIAESLVLALLGGAGGVVLAGWLLEVVLRVMANAIPRLGESSIDGTVLLFATSVSVLTAVLFGLGPAIALCRTNVQEVLKDGVKSASASRRSVRAVRVVVALQLALTVVLLSGAGLMIKSMWRMNALAPGFHPGQILSLRVDFSGAAYKDPAAKRAYVDRLTATVGALPGVQSVAITTGGDSMMLVLKEGQPIPENRAAHAAGLSATTPNFPSLVGMRLVRGEWLSAAEPRGILINESAARRNFAGSDPIGQRIQFPWVADQGFAPIVGVVADMKFSKLDAEPGPEVFVNYAGAQLFGITALVHLDGDPLAAAPTIRQVVADLDRTQPVFDVKTMERALAESIAPRRFTLLLIGTFAAAALLLAVLGIYGVVAYAVAERTHEIGIRLALGAHRHRVVRMVVRQGMASVIAGIAIGLGAAALLAGYIATLLYDVEPTDPATYAVVTIAIAAVAFIACAAPALKAAFVDPVIALRYE
jgi:putative ABC transport system permease protein